MKRIVLAARLAVPLCATVFLFAGSAVMVETAHAQRKSKSTKTEAKFISYDDATKTMTVKVLKSGKRPKNNQLAGESSDSLARSLTRFSGHAPTRRAG